MTKPPAFRRIATPLDVDDAALARVADQMGVPRLVKPSPPQPAADAPIAEDASRPAEAGQPPTETQVAPRPRKPTSPSRRTALEKLTVEIPGYLIDAVKREALDRRTTARHVLMLALQTAGFKIDPADLVPDARRQRRKSG